jgi:hypothetical protein
VSALTSLSPGQLEIEIGCQHRQHGTEHHRGGGRGLADIGTLECEIDDELARQIGGVSGPAAGHRHDKVVALYDGNRDQHDTGYQQRAQHR